MRLPGRGAKAIPCQIAHKIPPHKVSACFGRALVDLCLNRSNVESSAVALSRVVSLTHESRGYPPSCESTPVIGKPKINCFSHFEPPNPNRWDRKDNMTGSTIETPLRASGVSCRHLSRTGKVRFLMFLRSLTCLYQNSLIASVGVVAVKKTARLSAGGTTISRARKKGAPRAALT